MIACCLFDEPQDWPQTLERLSSFTDRIDSPKEGLVFLAVTEAQAQQIAASLRIPAGLGLSQEASHLLSLTARPGEVIANEERINDIPITVLERLELSPKVIQRLVWLGVETVGDLRRWSKAQLSLYLGSDSKTVIRYLQGPYRHDVARYQPQEVVSASHIFEEAVLEPNALEPIIRLLCQRLTESLGNRAASRLNLVATSQGLAFKASRISKTHLNQPAGLERFVHLALQDSGILGLEVDELRIELAGLYRPSVQGTLWWQREILRKAVDAVEQRFPGSLLRFAEINPYSPVSEFRFRLLSLRQGEEVASEANRGQAREWLASKPRGRIHQLHH